MSQNNQNLKYHLALLDYFIFIIHKVFLQISLNLSPASNENMQRKLSYSILTVQGGMSKPIVCCYIEKRNETFSTKIFRTFND